MLRRDCFLITSPSEVSSLLDTEPDGRLVWTERKEHANV